jgi:hypothetical protein
VWIVGGGEGGGGGGGEGRVVFVLTDCVCV